MIAVKGNQPKLMQLFETALRDLTPHSQYLDFDTSHGRRVQRSVKVFAAPRSLCQSWSKAESLVVVHRQGVRENQAFERTSFYLSSLSLSAREAHVGIRNHRDIENGLHWVRDVVFQEDKAPFKQVAPALNWSALRSIALNLFRSHGYHSLTSAIRLFRDDLPSLFSLLKTNIPYPYRGEL